MSIDTLNKLCFLKSITHWTTLLYSVICEAEFWRYIKKFRSHRILFIFSALKTSHTLSHVYLIYLPVLVPWRVRRQHTLKCRISSNQVQEQLLRTRWIFILIETKPESQRMNSSAKQTACLATMCRLTSGSFRGLLTRDANAQLARM